LTEEATVQDATKSGEETQLEATEIVESRDQNASPGLRPASELQQEMSSEQQATLEQSESPNGPAVTPDDSKAKKGKTDESLLISVVLFVTVLTLAPTVIYFSELTTYEASIRLV